MATTQTHLVFSTSNQSLWLTSGAPLTRIDTGKAMVFDPPEYRLRFNPGALGFEFNAVAYLDMKLGFVAYAELPDPKLATAGTFSATFALNVDVLHPAAIDTTRTSQMVFDFSHWSNVSSSVTSTGFKGSPKAGLDFLVGLSAGFKNIYYETPFTSRKYLDDWSLINVDSTISVFTLTADDPSFSVGNSSIRPGRLSGTPTGSYVTIKATLPTGADTSNQVTGQGNVAAAGTAKDPFLDAEIDLDKLLFSLGKKLLKPKSEAGAAAADAFELLVNKWKLIFLEFKLDLGDVLPIGHDNVVVGGSLLDVSFHATAVISEKVAVAINDDAHRPSISVTLRSDNGTPGNFSDDVVRVGKVGEAIALPVPTGGGQGYATVTAFYDLDQAFLAHSVGVGMNAYFQITALKAFLDGDWIPSSWKKPLGPLLDLKFPSGGFTASLGDGKVNTFTMVGGAFTNATDGTSSANWLHAPNAFNQVSADYQVFYTDVAPVGWNPEALGAVQAATDFRQQVATNLASSITDTAGLRNSQSLPPTAALSFNQVPFPTANTTLIWQGNIDSIVRSDDFQHERNNFVIVDPRSGLAGGALRVNLSPWNSAFSAPATPGAWLFNNFNAVGSNGTAADKSLLLHRLQDTVAGAWLIYQFGDGVPGATTRTLSTNFAPEVIGGTRGDLLVYWGTGSQFFDGGGQGAGEFDVFMADFNDQSGHLDVPVVWNLSDAVLNNKTVKLRFDVTVKNVEAMWIITSSAPDDITTYIFSDWVETRGGDDFVSNVADTVPDTILAGRGNDVITNLVKDVPAALAAALIDSISGGPGRDQVAHVQSAQGLRVNLLVNGNPQYGNVAAGDGLGPEASLSQLTDLVFKHRLYIIDAAGTYGNSDPLARDGSSNALLFINHTVLQGATRYDADIEGIGVIGSNTANDLVLFTGGLTTRGGTGPASSADVLAADFTTIERQVNATKGLNLTTDGPATFGDAYIDGFERLVVLGSSFDDALRGGALGDLFSGEGGDDVLSGGSDTVRDILFGGAGNDIFIWNNSGPDAIDGDFGYRAAGSATDIDTLVISANGSETNGLWFDVLTSVAPPPRSPAASAPMRCLRWASRRSHPSRPTRAC